MHVFNYTNNRIKVGALSHVQHLSPTGRVDQDTGWLTDYIVFW